MSSIKEIRKHEVPCTVIFEELDDCLLLTVQVYSPPDLPDTMRVWVYKASIEFFKTVDTDCVRMSCSLVQMTLVADPPVETQVRVNNVLFSLRLELRMNLIFCVFTDPVKIVHIDQIMYCDIII